MKEPTRWLDDPQTQRALREVLGAARQVPAIPAQAHAELVTLAATLTVKTAVPVTFGATALKSLGSLLGIHSTGKALLFASMMGALGVGSYVGVRQLANHAPMAKREATLRSPSTRTPLAASGSLTPESPPIASAAANAELSHRVSLVASTRAVVGQGTAGAKGAAGVGQGGARAFEELSIADEAHLLERARALLPTEPKEALDIANAHQRLYPNGQLSAERELIAVDALLRLGRRAEAERRAEPSLRQAPNGIYARRLRTLLK